MTPRIIVATLMIRLRSLCRETSAMFFTVAFPVILILVFGALFTTPEHAHFALTVQDRDRTAASADLVRHLDADGVFNTSPMPADADAVQYAKDHRLNLVLIIPQGLEEAEARAVAGTADASVALTYVYDPSSTSVTTKLQYLTAFVAAVNQHMSGAQPFLTLVEQSILDKRYRFIEFFVPGIIAMAIMTSSLSGALAMNAELRQKGILRKLATTPITRVDWLLSNILYQLLLGVVSTACILCVSYAVFDVRLQLALWLPVFVVLEVFVFVGLGMTLTPIVREAESAAAAANAILLPMMFLSGTFFPVDMMPSYLQTVARFLPLYYVNEGLRASMIFNDTLGAGRNAALTAAIAVAAFCAGMLLTRWTRET